MVSWNFTNRNHLPIGLDIGHSSIKMVQLAGGAPYTIVVAAEKMRLAPEVEDDEQKNTGIISSVSQMLSRGRFVGKNVITTLPNEQLHVTSLRIAQMPEEEIEKAVREEAGDRFGLGGDEDLIDYLIVGDVKQAEEVKNELILFAAGGQAVREHIELVEAMGLTPVGIDPIPCALFRNFERLLRRQEDKQKTTVFVDIGSRFTTIVFGRAGQISFIKEVPVGADRFNLEIAGKLDVSPDEAEVLRTSLRTERSSQHRASGADGASTALKEGLDISTRQAVVDAVGAVAQELAKEISLCLRYYTVTFRGRRVERAFFSGGGAYESVLLNVLKRQLTVEVEVAEPFKGFDITSVDFDSDRRGALCEWAVATGLALKSAAS